VTFAPAAMSHTGTTGPLAAGNCSTCHNGSYLAQNAQAKSGTHISTSAQCDTCHTSTTSWATAPFNHATANPPVAGICASCHNGTNALGKPTNHIPTGAQCDTCHKNFTAFAPATMSHAGTTGPLAAGNCSTCHNGSYAYANALAKTASHIPTTAQCDTCHNNYTAFTPASMSHAGTAGPAAAGNCATCHNGSYTAVNARAKPVSHIPTVLSCDTCHTTTAWKPTSFNHQGVVAGTCTTCHNDISAVGKPAAHIPTSQSCEVCHKTGISWLPLVTPYSHTGVVAASCSSCHGGSYTNIDVKPASTHLPTSDSCDACHTKTAWLPPTAYAHTGIAAGTCSTCHGGAYTSIVTKPGNHIPVAQWPSCDACHKSYASFANAKIHTTAFTATTAYPGTCLNCHSPGNPYGVTTRTSDHSKSEWKNFNGKLQSGLTTCDASGCHTSVKKWN
jgi:hypothetical protein